MRPPRRSADSNTVTSSDECRRQFECRGESGDAPADHGDPLRSIGHRSGGGSGGSTAATTRPASADITAGSLLTLAVRSKARPGRCGAGRGLDVEVVQHLEVVGDEAAGAHDDAADSPDAGRVRRSPAGCRARSMARASVRLIATRSTNRCLRPDRVRSATATAVERSSSGYGSPPSMMRCGREWAVNSTSRLDPSASRMLPGARRGRRRGTRRRPARSPNCRCRPPARAPPAPVSQRCEVVADRIRRVVRCEHQADDPSRLPARRLRRPPPRPSASVCFMPSDTTNVPGARSSSDRCSASRCASVHLGERRDATDRGVAAR